MLSHIWRHILLTIDQMDMQDWVLVLAGMILVAVVCMRGYGSRSSY